MKYKLFVILIFAFASNFVFADSSIDQRVSGRVAPLTAEMIAELANPSPEGGNSTILCDSFGYTWRLIGFPKNPLVGEANLFCAGLEPVGGEYEYWPWFVMRATAFLDEQCYCNAEHTMELTWNSNVGLFQGTAYAIGGDCPGDASTPVVVGRCRVRGDN